ncbi:mycothiol synthase [Gordonia malaquae]|uniref:Mycothiol acetyltransferase n=1 Tax=Gordonia malaquae NBRC 108250 TaxID=1223542 RepID=M3UWH3_GORML|nr:mycothiol synthase [Gordonia malaquae]GAC79992.1 mycothiol acetyltransferase [Gordonia malaquae NBRC 108250]SEB85668.1 mycothiol synthase [Gordonia malaquae]
MTDIRIVRGHLAPDDVEHALAANAAAEQTDGIDALSEQHRHAVQGEGVHVVTAGGYGNVIGPMAEAVVHPEHRGFGQGRALVAALLDVASEAGDDAQIWAHGDLPAAARVAEALGLRRERELLQLRRRTSQVLPELPSRDDIVLRTYRETDDAEILRVNNAAFDWHPEQGGWAQEQITERTTSGWFDPAGVFLAFDSSDPDRLLGFHWTKVDKPGLGEVYIVGVDPAAQGRGLGRLLTLAGLHYLEGRGVDEVELYVEGDNTAALHTYDRLGFRRYRADITYRRP